MSVGTAIINETEEKYKDGNEVPARGMALCFPVCAIKFGMIRNMRGQRSCLSGERYVYRLRAGKKAGYGGPEDHRAVWMRIEEAA